MKQNRIREFDKGTNTDVKDGLFQKKKLMSKIT